MSYEKLIQVQFNLISSFGGSVIETRLSCILRSVSCTHTHTLSHSASVVSCSVCLYSVIPSRLDVLRCHLISGHSFPPAFLVYLLVCVYLTRSSRLGNKLALNIQTDYSECITLWSSGEEKEGPLASLVPLQWIISLPTLRLLSEPDPTTVPARANVIFEQGLKRDIDDMREKRLEQQDKSRRTIWQ